MIKQLNNEFSLVDYPIRAKTREKDTYIEFSIAESLENKGKLRKLIDNSQFVVNIYILLFRKTVPFIPSNFSYK